MPVSKDKKSPSNISKRLTGHKAKPTKYHTDKVSNVCLDPISFLQRQFGNRGIQAKLKIGKPNDRYEQEADRISDLVMQIPDSDIQGHPEEEEEELLQPKLVATESTPIVQRQDDPEEDEEEVIQPELSYSTHVQRKEEDPENEEEEHVQEKQAAGKALLLDPSLENEIRSLRGGGHPLRPSDLAFFERCFGRDFSHVRVHTGHKAAKAAGRLNAYAFTMGENVVFNAEQYAPSNKKGRSLLAHELTHVVQQGRGTHKVTKKGPLMSASNKTKEWINYSTNMEHSFTSDSKSYNTDSKIKKKERYNVDLIKLPKVPETITKTVPRLIQDTLNRFEAIWMLYKGALENFETKVKTEKNVFLTTAQVIVKELNDYFVDKLRTINVVPTILSEIIGLALSIGKKIEDSKKNAQKVKASQQLSQFIVNQRKYIYKSAAELKRKRTFIASNTEDEYKKLKNRQAKKDFCDRLIRDLSWLMYSEKTTFSLENMFFQLVQIWIRKTKIEGKPSQINILLDNDWKVIKAHIRSPKGAQLAGQLLSDQGKVNLQKFSVPRIVSWIPKVPWIKGYNPERKGAAAALGALTIHLDSSGNVIRIVRNLLLGTGKKEEILWKRFKDNLKKGLPETTILTGD